MEHMYLVDVYQKDSLGGSAFWDRSYEGTDLRQAESAASLEVFSSLTRELTQRTGVSLIALYHFTDDASDALGTLRLMVCTCAESTTQPAV